MDELRLIREQGTRRDSYYYHVGDGYHYRFNDENESGFTIYFKCKIQSCSGRAVFRRYEGFRHTEPHNHAPDILYSEVNNARRRILEQSRSLTYMSFSDILNAERRRIPNRLVRAALTIRRLRPAMQRTRSTIFPTIPPSLTALTATLNNPAWANLIQTLDGADSMYLGSTTATDGSHSVLFCSARCLEVMRVVDILFADGTFFITPAIDNCYQIIPLFWCLMERKTEAAYVSVLIQLQNHLQQYNFHKVVTDYEDAIINAFKLVFRVEVQGCFFHSASAMARHAKVTIGVLLISQTEEIMMVVRLCCALPLLPQNLLQRGLHAIGTEALNLNDQFIYDIVRPFLLYVQNDWLNHVNRGPCLSVCLSDHRTNNASESNNRDMKRQFGVHHPNVFHFIRKLADFEDNVVDDLYALSVGNIPTRHRPVKAIYSDARIQALTSHLLSIPNPSHQEIMQFLVSASPSVNRIVNDALDI
ncbi:Nonribosomal peptide synthetase TES [Frankliniella fusca]|uniref:Nonribosomal peptide synthetase TES n=1 Tax=Frankliniella fusca TaxID=407009 RepID=A0AAE1HFY1_9NEOP|nr:Nonribosomal peptide synthetase TES [Frankliniella fusca]